MAIARSIHDEFPDPNDQSIARKLRAWWHRVLASYGRYKIYAVFLVLPRDKAVIDYLSESFEELDIISGENCLVLLLNENQIGSLELTFDAWTGKPVPDSSRQWEFSVKEHVTQGLSTRVARLFKIRMTDLPGIILFRDVRSPDHIYIKLRGMDANDISLKMREIFTVIDEAVRDQEDPLNAIERQVRNEKFVNAGKSFVTVIRRIGESSMQTAVEAVIKSQIP